MRRPQAVHDHGYKLVMYLALLAAPKKRHDKNEWLHELLHSEQYKCIKTYKND